MRILIYELIPLILTQRRFKIDDRLQTSARGRNWLAELQVAANLNAASAIFALFTLLSAAAARQHRLSSQEASWLHSSTALRILHYSARIIPGARLQTLVAALSSMHPHAPSAHIFICLHALLTSPCLYIYCTADHNTCQPSHAVNG